MLLRRHREPGLQVVMERWFEEVAAHSHRDQLSFNVVAREIGFSPGFLPGTLYANDLMKWPVVTRVYRVPRGFRDEEYVALHEDVRFGAE